MSSRLVRLGLAAWAEAIIRAIGEQPAAHHRLLMAELEALGRGEIDRLIVQMPPGAAKSTYASILLPAWWFATHPGDLVIAASHTASLAAYLARRARMVIAEQADALGYSITSDSRASAQWSLSTGGEYYAVGIRGAIVGRRADLVIIDDPIKSQSIAESAGHRERMWEWYRSDVTPRLKPKARIILVMTRWHEDDLCGRLLDGGNSVWRSLCLPAIAGEADLLKRRAGQPLWPEWEDLDALQRRRAATGERTWWAQYQQSPRMTSESLFKVEKLEILDAAPKVSNGYAVRAWDLAATTSTLSQNPDWTVGVKLIRTAAGSYVVSDVVRMQGSPRQVEDRIAATARIDGGAVTIVIPEDPGQAGKSQVDYLVRALAGYHVMARKETGAKSTRAKPISSQMEIGNVSLVRGDWNYAFIEELRDFPFGRKDDQVDALSSAFTALMSAMAPARFAPVNYLER